MNVESSFPCSARVLFLLLLCSQAREPCRSGVCPAESPRAERGLSMIQVARVTSPAVRDLHDRESDIEGKHKIHPKRQRPILLATGRQSSRSKQDGSGLQALGGLVDGQNAAREARTDVDLKTQLKSGRGPKTPGWFGSFSEAESTYDEDGVVTSDNPEAAAILGELPNMDNPFVPQMANGMSAEWFEETASGGPDQAWQTYYPRLEDVKPDGLGGAAYTQTGGIQGAHQQLASALPDLAKDIRLTDGKHASWFDTSVTQYDAFGRIQEPSDVSGRRYLDWQLRTKNTTLTCAAAGCTAEAVLDMVDHDTEDYRHCQATVSVHATDFDDEHSRENVEFVTINGENVVSKCDPQVSGCGDTAPTADKPLYPCVTDAVLSEHIMTEGNGSLTINAKLSPMVDECAVDGNLLSGVVSVSCFVRPKDEPVPTPLPTTLEEAEAELTNWSVPLQCAEPGCEANASITLGVGAINKTCLLTVTFNQTDFEGGLVANESILFIKVEDEIKAENLEPGKNPCHEALSGNTEVIEPFVAISDVDVTTAAQAGKVNVVAKIASMVDECGSSGFLLDALATVVCT